MKARDEELLARVAARTTGANVHDVNGLLGYYRSVIECLNRPPESAHQERLANAGLVWVTTVLGEFADTGDIKTAKANSPTQ